jgi:hypothetical protein
MNSVDNMGLAQSSTLINSSFGDHFLSATPEIEKVQTALDTWNQGLNTKKLGMSEDELQLAHQALTANGRVLETDEKDSLDKVQVALGNWSKLQKLSIAAQDAASQIFDRLIAPIRDLVDGSESAPGFNYSLESTITGSSQAQKLASI